MTQNTNSYDIQITGDWEDAGENYNYDFNVSEANADVDPLYDPNGVQMAVSALKTAANASIRLITYDLDYLAGFGVEYANSGWVQIERTDLPASQTDIFPAFYGSGTQDGDLPSSGSKSYTILPYLFIERWAEAGTNTIRALAEGAGELVLNFGDNTLEGTITLSRYYNYDQFLASGSDYSQLLGLEAITLSITDGTLNPDTAFYSATMTVNHQNQDGTSIVGSGVIRGYLMGPDGDEIGGSFVLQRDSDNEVSDLYFWDSIGNFLGRS